jgi:hypothetical protein
MPPKSAAAARNERSPSPVAIGPVPFASAAHYERVLAHIKANVDEEVTRVLHEEGAEGDAALRREVELLVYEVRRPLPALRPGEPALTSMCSASGLVCSI